MIFFLCVCVFFFFFVLFFVFCMDRIYKSELPPELKVEARGVMNRPKICESNIGPIIRVSITEINIS